MRAGSRQIWKEKSVGVHVPHCPLSINRCGRNGFWTIWVRTRRAVTTPEKIPSPKAAIIFPMANPGPSSAHVAMSIVGPVTGEESQNAMMGASGTPDARNPVVSGNTVTPHTGVTVPMPDAITTVATGRPLNHRAVMAAAPLAATHAERTSPIAIISATSRKLCKTKWKVSCARCGHVRPATIVRTAAVAHMTRFCMFGSAMPLTNPSRAVYGVAFH